MLVNVDGQICQLVKAGPFMGPQGGLWRDPEHKVPWKQTKGKPKSGEKPKPKGGRVASVKMPDSVVSVFETDVHELAADPEGHGLDESEARAYKLIDRAHDRATNKFRMPADKAQARKMIDVLTHIANSADDRAEAGEETKINRRIASAVSTLSSKVAIHAEKLEKAQIYEGPKGGRYRDPEHKIPYIGPATSAAPKTGFTMGGVIDRVKQAIKNPNPTDVRSTFISLMAVARESPEMRPKLKEITDKFAGLSGLPPASKKLADQASKMLAKMMKAPKSQPMQKAEARGGNYFRRVPRKNGKGHNYYYDEEKYAASKGAHLDGPATRAARLTKAVLGAVDGGGKKGCTVKSLAQLAKREGKEHVAKAIKGCLEKGDLSYKKGTLYRKVMEQAKEKSEDEKDQKNKGLKKASANLRLGPDLLVKAGKKGPIGIGKKGGKIYGWDKHGKPIYAPSDAPSKPGKPKKKKPAAPSPQLSLFGQTKLEKPKLGITLQNLKDLPVGTFIRLTELSTGKTILRKKVAPDKVILGGQLSYQQSQFNEPQPIGEVYHERLFDNPNIKLEVVKAKPQTPPKPKVAPDLPDEPVTVIEAKPAPGFAIPPPPAEHVTEQPHEERATIEVEQEKHEAKPVVETVSAPIERPETTPQPAGEWPPVRPDLKPVKTQEELLAAPVGSIIRLSDKRGFAKEYQKILADQVISLYKGGPGETEQLIKQVVRKKDFKDYTVELETKTDPVIADLESRISKAVAVQFKRDQAFRQGLDAVVDTRNIGREDLPPKLTDQQHAELEKRFAMLPSPKKGWQTLTEPYSKEDWTQEAAHNKIESMPEGSVIRVTKISGEYRDYKRVAENKVSLVPKKGEPESISDVALRIADILPQTQGLTMAQVDARYPTKAETVEKLQAVATAATAGLPEIPPKPPAPPRVARENFRSEMQRRSDMHLYPRGESYSVKDEIKDVGGIWDRYNKLWLLPSQEALDYIHAKMAHANAELHEEAVKATADDRTVSGKTYAIRDKIRAAGGKWDGTNKQWIMPTKEAAEEMRALMERKSRRKKG